MGTNNAHQCSAQSAMSVDSYSQSKQVSSTVPLQIPHNTLWHLSHFLRFVLPSFTALDTASFVSRPIYVVRSLQYTVIIISNVFLHWTVNRLTAGAKTKVYSLFYEGNPRVILWITVAASQTILQRTRSRHRLILSFRISFIQSLQQG